MTAHTSPTHPHVSAHGARVDVARWGWRHAGRKKWILDNLSFHVDPGEKVLLLGASGSGKSTLLAGIAGLLDNDNDGDKHGEILVNNGDPRQRRGDIGLVMQDPEAQVVLAKVCDDVAFGCENLGVPSHEIWDRVDHSLSLVGADIHPLHNTSELSGGQKQRLALAAVLAMRPSLILLDEPTANVDPEGVKALRLAVERALDDTGATAIIIEHRIDIWADLINRVIVIDEGRIIADGPLEDVLNTHSQRLRQAGIWLPGDEYRIGHEVPPLATDNPATTHIFRPLSTLNAPDTLAETIIDSDTTPTSDNVGQDILSVRDLNIGYSENAPIRTDIHLTFRRGSSTCIIGSNGCGKSTLGLTLAGLLHPLSGTITYTETHRHPTTDGQKKKKAPQSIGFRSPHQWKSHELLGRIAFVFQEPEYQFLENTVQAELELGLRLAGQDEVSTQRICHDYLEALRLTHLAQAHPMSLSGGEKRRLSVATALVNTPDVLILDEPTFGQDRNSWKEMVRLLKHARAQGTTLISITHDQAFIEAMDADVINLDEVGQVGVGKTRSLRDSHPSDTRTSAQANMVRHSGRKGIIDHLNPVTLFLCVAIMTTPVITSVDIVTGAVALGLELLCLPLTHIPLSSLMKRLLPVIMSAPFASLSMLLYGRAEGEIWWSFGPAVISDHSINLAISIILRIFAMAIPAVVLFPSIDPTDMADGLTQVLKAPPRPVIASLAAARMVGLMMHDWAALGWARRMRGKGDSRGFSAFFHAAFALLVFALRRSAKLSITMEARGFGSDIPRTYARKSHMGSGDVIAIVISIIIPVIYVSAAIWAGTYNFFGTTR